MKKNLTLLYDLQLSVLDSLDDGKFLFTPDSNVNVATFFLKELNKQRPDWKIICLVPDSYQLKEERLIFTDKLPEGIILRPYRYYGNPFVDRMSFRGIVLFSDEKIDIVYTNDPCKVLSYKTFLYQKQKEFVPVISRNHWITGKAHRKVPEEIDFIFRQGEGAIYGDWMTFNSEFAKKLFLDNLSEFYNKDAIEKISKKLDFFDAVDIEKIDKHKISTTSYKRLTILWGHRLSYYTGWEETFNALLKLKEDFQVIVPDPGNKFTQAELKKRWPFIKPIDKINWNHKKYIETCWLADICLGNHKYPATWGGLAITEPMAAYTCPVIPNRHAYKEMFYEDKDIFFKNEIDMVKKIKILIKNPSLLKEKQNKARKFCEKQLSPSIFTSKIISKIEELCKVTS